MGMSKHNPAVLIDSKLILSQINDHGEGKRDFIVELHFTWTLGPTPEFVEGPDKNL
jgi:hypothetical protein